MVLVHNSHIYSVKSFSFELDIVKDIIIGFAYRNVNNRERIMDRTWIYFI